MFKRPFRIPLTLALAWGIVCARSITASAAAPSLINAQGVLTDNAGVPITTQQTVTFTIYDDPSAGTTLWAEKLDVTPDANGLFNVVLGQVTPITDAVFSDVTRWLGVTISPNPELIPRIRLVTAPYSFRVQTVDEATGGDIRGDVHLHSNLTVGEAGDGGRVDVVDNTGTTRIRADAAGGNVQTTHGLTLASTIGGTTYGNLARNGAGGGALNTYDELGVHTVFLGSSGGAGGLFYMYDDAGTALIKGDGDAGTLEATQGLDLVATVAGSTYAGLGRNGTGGGVLRTYDELGNQTLIGGSVGTGGGGFINVHMNASIWPGVVVDGDDGNSGQLLLKKANDVTMVELDGDAGDGGSLLTMSDGTRTTVSIDANGAGGGAGVLFYNSAGVNTVTLDGDATDAGQILVDNAAGVTTVEIDAAEGAGGSQILLRNAAGVATIQIDAEYSSGAVANGRVVTEELQITGGSDLSEQFDVCDEGKGIAPAPGMVVSIDADCPGRLVVSTRAHDRRVAGIVSGAGGVNTGMIMGQKDTEADGKHPVALAGRVYCMADASGGSIEPGDLLTTSDVPGHAMKVTDYGCAQGAIIGKAMTGLTEGRGLVLVLVTLQ